MISVVMLATKQGRLIKVKVETKDEGKILEFYGRDWHKIQKIERVNGVSHIEILQFSKFMISRMEELMGIA